MTFETVTLWLGITAYAASVVQFLIARKHLHEARDLLDQVKASNKLFFEAMELFRYGALDEAVELLQADRE